MDTTSFRYLLAMVLHLFLDIYLLDVITTYLYDILDTALYITLPPGFLSAIPQRNRKNIMASKYSKPCMDLNRLAECGTTTSETF